MGQLAWTSDWHIRDETYLLALRCLVNQQQREPFTAHFGNGMASSSDGQFFNVELIRAHWSEILRLIASIRTGTVTASLIMRQLASYSRQNGVAAALRELGRMERTLFTLA